MDRVLWASSQAMRGVNERTCPECLLITPHAPGVAARCASRTSTAAPAVLPKSRWPCYARLANSDGCAAATSAV